MPGDIRLESRCPLARAFECAAGPASIKGDTGNVLAQLDEMDGHANRSTAARR